MSDELCKWTVDSDILGEEVWNTSCGNAFCFTDGDPKDNKFVFCPYCGHQIMIIIVLKRRNSFEEE